MDLKEFNELMKASERESRDMLGTDYADFVRKHVTTDCMADLISTRKNVIFLETRETADDAIPVGASKIGGYPDLPPSISIPEFSGYTGRSYNGDKIYQDRCSMQLIAQINLAEFAAYDRDKRLPEKGMLYFFWSGEDDYLEYLRENGNLVFDGDDTEIHKVIYYDGDLSLLKRTKPALPYGHNFEEPLDVCRLTPKLNTYLYDEEALFGIFRKESQENIRFLTGTYEKWSKGSRDRLLGYFNGSMNVTPGKNLLFQNSYHSGNIWEIYWFIEDEDFAAWRFENSYMRFDVD